MPGAIYREDGMRLFICTSLKFPYGSAAANRLLAIGKMARESNIEPMVIACGENIAEEYDEGLQAYQHNGVRYSNNGTANSMVGQLEAKNRTIRILDRYSPGQNDIILIYSNVFYFAGGLAAHAKKSYGCKVIFDITEWHRPFQFNTGCFHPYYLSFLINTFFVMPEADGILCISKYLSEKKMWKNVPRFILPSVLDVSSYGCSEGKHNKKKIYIYPGNPGKKDDFASMLKGFLLLSGNERKQIEFHITSVKPQTLSVLLGKDAVLLDKLKDIMVFHDWMEYSELLKLYSTADFLLIAKPDNIVSRANFPSKAAELMACGVIPVITKVGDISQYVTDHYDSLLIEEDAPELIVQAIRKSLSLSESGIAAMRRNARTTAETNFDYRVWSKRLVDFFEQIQGGAH